MSISSYQSILSQRLWEVYVTTGYATAIQSESDIVMCTYIYYITVSRVST